MSTELKMSPFFMQDCVIGPAKLAGAHDDGLEHRSNFGRRGCDHLQNIGAPGLVGQSFW